MVHPVFVIGEYEWLMRKEKEMGDLRRFPGGYVVLPLEQYEALMERCAIRFVPQVDSDALANKKQESIQAIKDACKKKKTTHGTVDASEKDDSDYTPGYGRKKRNSVDAGKLYALQDAGWTAKQIAEELNISVATVYKYIGSR